MASTLDKFTRSMKMLYQELGNVAEAGKIGIDKLLFNVDDMDTVSDFTLDSLIVNPHAVSFRARDEQSHIREYQAGSGTVYEVPHVSEKTEISERLRDSVVAGVESTSGISTHDARLMTNIINQHTVAYSTTRWKRALDVIRTGVFYALGLNGNSVGLDINFGRNASLDITYDFTTASASIDEALKDLYDAYMDAGGNPSGVVVIAGSNWLSEFQNDTTVMERMQANTANVIVQQSIMPPELKNTQGLYLLATYLIPGTLTPIYLCGFRPRYQFIAYPGATEEPFMPVNEAVIFSLDDPRYRVFRGVDALSGPGQRIRTVGEIVFDSYISNDPVAENIRSQTRMAFVPGNVNRTARSTGTFPTAS